ncbi:MAG: hypothetical protein H6815_05315 [Phycisphaeraceae bacterium]|nr:hypothetical protein [Phycisphaerales bacterium]MCB9859856.1 hypothetical protein [Phycisphaeraceae bacterium]
MASSFKSLDLFGSGPHRFRMGVQGVTLLENVDMSPPAESATVVGATDLTVVVEGRLAASTESALWDLRDAISDELASPPAPGTLIDLHGRTWADMSFIEYEEHGPTDRGRVRSLGYTATFRRFAEV